MKDAAGMPTSLFVLRGGLRASALHLLRFSTARARQQARPLKPEVNSARIPYDKGIICVQVLRNRSLNKNVNLSKQHHAPEFQKINDRVPFANGEVVNVNIL